MVGGAVWGMVQCVQDGKHQTLHISAGKDISSKVIVFMQQQVEEEGGLVVLQVCEEGLVQRGELQLEGCHSLGWCALSWVCQGEAVKLWPLMCIKTFWSYTYK